MKIRKVEERVMIHKFKSVLAMVLSVTVAVTGMPIFAGAGVVQEYESVSSGNATASSGDATVSNSDLNTLRFATRGAVPNFDTVFDNYITVDGTRLIDGNTELKFISLNYPQATSDTPWEQANAIKTIKAMGGNVTRSYTIPVWNGKNSGNAYVTGVDNNGNLIFDEDALNALDNLLAECNKHGIRLMIPLVDHWHWIGGMDGYVWLAGEAEGEPSSSGFQDWAWKFYSSEKCLDYFKQMITHLLERTNTVTGIKYKDDPAILCWETSNEAGGNQTNQQTYDDVLSAWTIEVVNHIKTIDGNHLTLDGRMSTTQQSRSASNPSDILGAHYYEGNYATRCADDTVASHEVGKPFILGEFGAKVEAQPCIDVFQAGVDNNTNGIMMWSLRAHKDGFGYYFHDEDGYWASYHWPGFVSGDYYGETEILRAIYAYAQIVNGVAANYEEAKEIPIPAPETEEAPLLYDSSFTNGSVGDIKWRGVVGGAWYEIQRADGVVLEANGDTASWTTIADENDYVYDSGRNWEDKAHDCIAGYHDETAVDGQTYSYRLRACNESGEGLWSNIVTVSDVKHVVVDELDLIAVSSTDANPTEIRRTYSSDHSANIEYSSSSIVNKSESEGYIEYKATIPIKDVLVKALAEVAEEDNPKICVSPDGINYTLLNVAHVSGTVEYSASDISDTTNYYYTRIYIQGNSKCKLDAVSLTYQNDGNSYLQEGSGAEVSTNVMIQDNTFGLEGASPYYAYKSANLEATTGEVKGLMNNTDETASLIYRIGDDINAYRVIAYHKNNKEIKVEYSYDGVTYQEAPKLSEGSKDAYTRNVYGDLNVSETVRVIRITFPQSSGEDVVLESVEISSGSKSIPLSDTMPFNTLEDGEYYFGNSTNIEAIYTISKDENNLRYVKESGHVDFTAYDCVYAWIKPDNSNHQIALQITDKNNNIWTSEPFTLSGNIGSMRKFALSDFTSTSGVAIDLSEVLEFAFLILPSDTISTATGGISLNSLNKYTGNYGVELKYSFDEAAESMVYIDNIYAGSSTKVDDFEGYSGSNNLLRSAYTKNTGGGSFDLTLDSTHKSEGSYGLRIDYSYDGKGYAGATKKMDLLNLSGYDGFVMYIESDGSKNDIKLQIETDVSTFSYTGYLTGIGPSIYYMPFSAIKEEAWAGSGHVLDATQNLKSVSIYTDLIEGVTSGTIYVDDLKGANFVDDLESKSDIGMNYEDKTVVSQFPYTISGTADYVEYISLSIGDWVRNIPVDHSGNWSYTITEESGLYNGTDIEIQAGIYYPNNDVIALASNEAKHITINVRGNDAPEEISYEATVWEWDFAEKGTEGWNFEGFTPWVEGANLVAWSADGFNATFSYHITNIPNGIYTLGNDIKVKSNMNNVQMALKGESDEVKSNAIDTADVLTDDVLLGNTFLVTDNQVTVVYYVSAPTDANGATFAVGDIKLYLVESTNYIENGDFSQTETEWPNLPISWETSYTGGDGYSPIKGENETFSSWASNPYTYELKQTVQNLSKGIYKLTADIKLHNADVANSIILKAGDKSLNVTSLVTDTEFTKVTLEDITVKDDSVTVSLNGDFTTSGGAVDNVILTRTGDLTVDPGGDPGDEKPVKPGVDPGDEKPVKPGVDPGDEKPVKPGVDLGDEKPVKPGVDPDDEKPTEPEKKPNVSGDKQVSTGGKQDAETSVKKMVRVPIEYMIARGDTLSQIAFKNHISLRELLTLNPQIKNPNRIYKGQRIIIGYTEVTESEAQEKGSVMYFTVQRGDSLSRIARKNRITFMQLIRLNPEIIKQRYIYPGQKIRIR